MSYSSRDAESKPDRAPMAGGSEGAFLPVGFLEWQRESRVALFRTVKSEGPEHVRTMPSHLPVLGTHSEDGSINLATKGFGLVPRPDALKEFTVLFGRVAEERDRSSADPDMKGTFEALLKFYGDTRNFDDTRLGGLEIFEGTTHANLVRDPRASLLFSGEAPAFPSYQVEGVVDIVSNGDPYYEFLLRSRGLFAKAQFHIRQRSYPYGYIFNVRAVRDKTPFPRRA